MKLIQRILVTLLFCIVSLAGVFAIGSQQSVYAEVGPCPWWTATYRSCVAQQEQLLKDTQATTADFACKSFKDDEGSVLVASKIESKRLKDACAQVFTYSPDGTTATEKLSGTEKTNKLNDIHPTVCGWAQGIVNNATLMGQLKISADSNGVRAIKQFCQLDAAAADQSVRDAQSNAASPLDAFNKCGPVDVKCWLQVLANNIAKGLVGFISAIVALIATIAAFMAGLILQIMSYIANELLLVNPASNQYIGVARSVFGVFSNLVNLVILFIFVKTGYEYIFDDKKSPDLSNFIITVATLAIGVQFSFSIAAAVIALSYNLGYIFLQTVSPGSSNPFLVFFAAVNGGFDSGDIKGFLDKMNNLFVSMFSGLSTEVNTEQVIGQLVGLAATQSVRLFTLLIGVWIMWLFIQKFAVRAASLFFLLITAPIGFVFLVAGDINKDVQKFGKDWWSGLSNNAIAYPIIVIGLAIGARLVYQVQAINSSATKFSTEGFNLFDTATYSILIAPLIQAILPGVIGLATLWIIYDWIENNLHTAVSGVTDKMLQFAGKGMAFSYDKYRRAAGAGALVATSATAGLSNLGARLSAGGQGAALATRLRRVVNQKGTLADKLRQFDSPETIAKANQAKQAMIAKQKSTTLASILKSGINAQGRSRELLDETFTGDGSLNPVNRFLPWGIKTNKNGSWSTYRTPAAINLATDAMTSAGSVHQAHADDFMLRMMSGDTDADIAYADKAAAQSGIRSIFTNQSKKQILEKYGSFKNAREAMEKFAGLQATQAASKKYGFGGQDSAADAAVMKKSLSQALNTNGLDINSIDPVEAARASAMIESNLLQDTKSFAYLMQLAETPDKFAAQISSDPALKKYFTSPAGIDFMRRQLGSSQKFAEFYEGAFTGTTGLMGFTKDMLNKLPQDASYDGFRNHIEDQFKKAVQKPEDISQRFFNDANAVTGLLEQARKTGPSAAATIAVKTKRPGLAFNTDAHSSTIISAQEGFSNELAAATVDAVHASAIGGQQVLNDLAVEAAAAQDKSIAMLTTENGLTPQILGEKMKEYVNGKDIFDPANMTAIRDEIADSLAIDQFGDFDPEKFAFDRNSNILDAQNIPNLRLGVASMAAGKSIDEAFGTRLSVADQQALQQTLASTISITSETPGSVKRSVDAIRNGVGTAKDMQVLHAEVQNISDDQLKRTLDTTVDRGGTSVTGKQVARFVTASRGSNWDMMDAKGAEMMSQKYKDNMDQALTEYAQDAGYAERAYQRSMTKQSAAAPQPQQPTQHNQAQNPAAAPQPQQPTSKPLTPQKGVTTVTDDYGNEVVISSRGSALNARESQTRAIYENHTDQQIKSTRGALQSKMNRSTDPNEINDIKMKLDMLDDVEYANNNTP